MIRVLLADDDDCFVAALAALLATDGRLLVIGRAHNGREAVELATTHSPDVVLMDIDMPVMDGVEATRHIQATVPATQVIALSGTDFDSHGRILWLRGLSFACSIVIERDGCEIASPPVMTQRRACS